MKTKRNSRLVVWVAMGIGMAYAIFRFGIDPALADRISDIRGTKHNFSSAADGSTYSIPGGSTGTVTSRTVKASSETQVCVFCHTPHGASATGRPLWNRKIAGDGYTQSYVLYDSATLDAKQVQGSLMQPGGSSKLCLSCHDGTVAIGNVNVLNGKDQSTTEGNKATNVVAMQSGVTTMPTGAGANTGFTRNLGTDLTNDHPISISYNDTLAEADGELRKPSLNTSLIGVRSSTNKPKLPLQNTGGSALYDPADTVFNANLSPYSINAQVQCTTCHDPHIRESNASVGNQKFLRLNRFQELNPPTSDGTFVSTDNAGDIICLACHDKAGASWAYSAHANPTVANETYSATHATRREFPADLPVWKASCLNCHDTHAVSGTRRLLREGTNEAQSTLSNPKPGGSNTSAIEETCYQCHDGGLNGTLTDATTVPNIRKDFFSSTYKMPITTAAQGTSGGGGGNVAEPHEITGYFTADASFIDCQSKGSACGKDFIEPRSKLGVANLKNRHVECTDCHNPHRVIRGPSGLPGTLSNANTTAATVNGLSGGHHTHTDTDILHTNIISGVLRGSWGVQSGYNSASFHILPNTYAVKRGDPGSNQVTDCAGAAKAACDSATYVTREYQICLKCHSDYGYSDNNKYGTGAELGNRPTLQYTGGTPTTLSNGLTMYTNQAKEFQAPSGHRGSPASTTDSGAGSSYQSNNHRSWHPVMDSTGRDLTARGGISSGNNPWRVPFQRVGSQTMYCTDCHGSSTTGTTVIPDSTNSWGPHGSDNPFILKGAWNDATSGTSNLLCFKCHNSTAYIGGETQTRNTGFYEPSGKGNLHRYHNARIGGSLRCTWCHIAVPHGWKNKALLVNLKDVGAEVGLTTQEIADSVAINGYSREPYYYKAVLKVKTFKSSGNWAIGDCGNGDSDKWMRANADAAKGEGICKSPP